MSDRPRRPAPVAPHPPKSPEFPTFKDFYSDVHGRPPLPWQDRLAAAAADGSWPAEIGVPTGLGKTACLDISVWALGCQAGRRPPERTAPTRLWYVVDRRLLVDNAYDHGIYLRDRLAHAKQGPLAAVADGLRHIAGGAVGTPPLHVTRLRGSAALGERPPHPAQPSVCFATVAMYGSRLLFRGYGSSTSMRPVDAALAGIDSLVLLDEAHLAPALIRLSDAIVQCDLGDPAKVLDSRRARPRIVALTATGRAKGSARFDLDEVDHAHALVRRRVNATKPVGLVETSRRALATDLAKQVMAGVGDAERPPACLVFVNTTGLATAVADKLRRDLDEVLVLTGRLRSREAAKVRRQLLADDGMRAGRPSDTRTVPLVVVATQTLEVGADLDADLLVTQSAGVRALVQRFGRLNRLGDRPEARGVIVHASDDKQPVIYGQESVDLWDRLCEAAGPDRVVDLGPARVNQVLGSPADKVRRAGELLPIHLWEWSKTTLPPHGEAPPELFYSGIEEEPPRVSVLWRAWVPDPGERCLPPVKQDEAVEVSITATRQLLEQRDSHAAVRRLAADRSTVEVVDARTVKPGDTIVVKASAGGYDPIAGFDPDADADVLDISPLTGTMLPLRPEVIRHLLPNAPAGDLASCFASVADLEDPDRRPDLSDWREIQQAIAQLMAAHEPHPAIDQDEWRTLCGHVADGQVLLPQPGSTPVVSWSVRRVDTPTASDVFDDLSFDATSIRLAEHLESVGEIAGRLGGTLGLDEPLIEALRTAGQLHDIGKADIRFQRWLSPEGTDQPLAKSSGTGRESRRQAAGWPRGGRHEILSDRLLNAAVEAGRRLSTHIDSNLVRHLILSHHGHGRPSLPAVADPMPTRVRHTVLGYDVTADADLAISDTDQPRRFRMLNAVYGYWGLALLEAILRQADHIASSTTEVA